LAEITCGVVQPDYSGCCDGPVGTTTPPTIITGPPGPPGPEGPQGPPGPVSNCPVYCGTGEPEGVQTSIVGGLYLQTDRAATSHPWFGKRTGTGNTGWSGWGGLRGAGAGSFAIGDNSAAAGVDAIAFGENTTASGLRSEAFGKSSSATATDAKAFGAGAVASAISAIAIGSDTLSAQAGGIAIGRGAQVNAGAENGIAIGDGATIIANADDSIQIGNSQLTRYGTIAIGQRQALTPGAGVNFNTTWGGIYIGNDITHPTGHFTQGTIAIGAVIEFGTTGTFSSQVVIGEETYCGGAENVLVGPYIVAYDDDSPAVGLAACTVGVGVGLNVKLNGDCVLGAGHDAVVRSDFSTALGPHARAGKDQNTDSCNALGRLATALGHRSQALGVNSTVADGHTASIALGYNALTTAAAQLMVGDDAVDAQINAVHFNGSATAAITADSAGRATFTGFIAQPSTTLVAGTTLNTTHGLVRVDATVGNLTILLPAAASVSGRQYTVKKVDVSVNTVTVDANAAETIDGAATVVLSAQWDSVTIQSNGTSWDVIG
jgi:hypothetical protein